MHPDGVLEGRLGALLLVCRRREVRDRVVELGVRASDPGTKLSFWVEVGAGYAYDPATKQFDLTDVRRDVAPSGEGASWTYMVGVGARALRAQALTIRPRFVRAGKLVTARMHVVRADTGRP